MAFDVPPSWRRFVQPTLWRQTEAGALSPWAICGHHRQSHIVAASRRPKHHDRRQPPDASGRFRPRYRQSQRRLALRGRLHLPHGIAGDAGDRPHRRAREIRPAVHLGLDVDGSHRPSVIHVPPGAHQPDHGARRLYHACRARRHGLNQLLRAVQRRPAVRLDRPHQRRACRVERRHQLQRQGGAQLQSGRAHRARAALRAGQRIRRCRARAVGLLGRRRDRRRQGHRPVRRCREGAPAQSQGPVFQGAGPGQHGRAARRGTR